MAGVEAAVAQVALAVVSEVIASVISQCADGRRSSKKRRGVETVRGQLRRPDRKLSALPLTVVNRLPPGKNLRDLDSALTSMSCQVSLREIVAIELCEEQQYAAAAADNLSAALAAQWTDVPLDGVTNVAMHISEAVRGATRRKIEELTSRDDAAMESLRIQAQQSRTRAILESSIRHRSSWSLFSSPERLAELQQWRTKFARQVIARHGHIVPPDYDQKRRVPMRELYVPPRISTTTAGGGSGAISIGHFMGELDRTVLLGDPGGGKSTAADYIASEYARKGAGRTPFVVVLRDYAQGSRIELSISDYIASQCGALYQCRPGLGDVEHLLLTGQSIVVFDGLDELLDPSRRRDVAERVELFAEAFPHVPILVTSRRVGYAQAQLDPDVFDVFELAGFDASDVENYVSRWFSYVDELPEEMAVERAAGFLKESRTIADLTSTPLMLSLMCIIYRGQGYLPRNRPDVYKRCATLLFETWDRSRQIQVELRTSSQMDNAVKHLAYWMFTSLDRAEAVSESEIRSEVANFLQTTLDDASERDSAAQEFVDFCRGRAWVLSEAGLDVDEKPLFKFTHRTFLEYFAAYEMTRRCNSPEELARELSPRVVVQEWDVVAQLAVQIVDGHSVRGAHRFFGAFADTLNPSDAVSTNNGCGFIWRCLGFTPTNAAFLRGLIESSMSASFALRESFEGDAADPPSILEAMGIMQESRDTFLREFESVIREWVASEDWSKRGFARFVLASWGVHGTANEVSAQHQEWSVDRLRSVVKEIGRGEEHFDDLWNIALIRRSVTLAEYVDALQSAGSEILPCLFRAQRYRPFGWGYVDWADGTLTNARRERIGADMAIADRIWGDLEFLGALVVVPQRIPMDSPAMDWFSTRHEVGSWSPNGRVEDAWWGLWVLLACHVEIGVASPRASFTNREAADVLVASLFDARKNQKVDLDVFVGTGFAFQSPDRRELRDQWMRCDVDYLVYFDPAPRAA